MYPRKFIIAAIIYSFIIPVHAQLTISATNTDYTVDFDNTLAGVNLGVFVGLGLIDIGISAGQLDSKAWSITGMSDGDVAFGGTAVTGDFSRGTTQGGETQGGLYAVNTNTLVSPDYGLGIQPTADDMSPGSIRLKLQNTIASTTIKTLEITYDVYSFNNEDRSHQIDLAYSSDNTTYYTIASKQTTTIEAQDASPAWTKTTVSKTIYGLNWATATPFYIAWQFDDLGGTGSRDEISIDNIVVNASATNPDLLITEIMYSPNSTEPDYEWIELYNNSSEAINLEEFILFDDSGSGLETVLDANFTLAASSGVILHNDAITSASFKTLWENGVNIPAIAINLPDLTNTGKTLGLWGNRAYFDGGTTSNAINSLSFQNGAGSWPTVSGTDGASIYLTSLSADNSDGSNWSMSVDAGTSPVGTAYEVTAQTGGGSRMLGAGSDTGSPYAGVPLPVTWLSFVGYVDGLTPTLKWSTALEINNDYFAIEQSKTGETWKVIGEITGQGTSYEVKNYEFTATNIDQPNYYRVTQIDFDGKSSTTRAILLAPDRMRLVRAYPTVFDAYTASYLKISGIQESRQAEIQLLSITGQLVYQAKFQPTDVITEWMLPTNLAPNTYLLQISEGGQRIYKTRIVLR